MFSWGYLEEAKFPIGGLDSGKLLSLLMRKHSHTYIYTHSHFTANTVSALLLSQSCAWISTLLSCCVMLPTPKPFTRAKELKPVLRKCMGKWLGKARDQREVIQLQGCWFPRVLAAIPLPRFCLLWFPVSRIYCISEGLKHLCFPAIFKIHVGWQLPMFLKLNAVDTRFPGQLEKTNIPFSYFSKITCTWLWKLFCI